MNAARSCDTQSYDQPVFQGSGVVLSFGCQRGNICGKVPSPPPQTQLSFPCTNNDHDSPPSASAAFILESPANTQQNFVMSQPAWCSEVQSQRHPQSTLPLVSLTASISTVEPSSVCTHTQINTSLPDLRFRFQEKSVLVLRGVAVVETALLWIHHTCRRKRRRSQFGEGKSPSLILCHPPQPTRHLSTLMHPFPYYVMARPQRTAWPLW